MIDSREDESEKYKKGENVEGSSWSISPLDSLECQWGGVAGIGAGYCMIAKFWANIRDL